MPRKAQREEYGCLSEVVEKVQQIVDVGSNEEVLVQTYVDAGSQIHAHTRGILTEAVRCRHTETRFEEPFSDLAAPVRSSIKWVQRKGGRDTAVLNIVVLPPMQHLSAEMHPVVGRSTHTEVGCGTALSTHPSSTGSKTEPEPLVRFIDLGGGAGAAKGRRYHHPNR